MAWNLRVSAALHQGDRKYMEDQYAIHYECDKESGKFLYVYFGIFDGHGGADAAKYTKTHLHKNITSNILFYSKDPNDVIKSIEEGFNKTHEDMWKVIGEWPKTATGLTSTAGTTASIVFIKDNHLYTGHVGDSGISVGIQPECLGRGKWKADHLTIDHKPDSPAEKSRIEAMGGKVVPKAGVPRVVWQRPRELGPVRKPNQVDHIPFLAVGRALGDLWSYNFDNEEYAISPKPDVQVQRFNPYEHKCLVLASDGLWNLLDTKGAVATVEMTDRKWFREAIYEKGYPKTGDPYYHHASTLVNIVLRRWRTRNLRADNTSAIVVMIDPAGPTVHKALDKMAGIASATRNRGQKFCARSYLKEHEDSLEDSEKYVLGMAGSYNIQYYEDRDRFELHYGKPAVRYNVPKGVSTENAMSSISMYDVIIHKVMTPCKSSNNLSSLSAPTFSKLRRTQSSKELKRFRPQTGAITFGSWLDEDTEGDSPPEEPETEADVLPVFIDEDENAVTKAPDALNTDDQLTDSPEESSSPPAAPSPVDTVETVESLTTECLSLPPSLLNQTSAPVSLAQANNGNHKNPILRKLKGVARSFASLHDGSRPVNKKASKSELTRSLRRTGRKPLVVSGSPIKAKRHSSSVDLLGAKRQRLSAPCVQLTKITNVSSPQSTVCLRPRQK